MNKITNLIQSLHNQNSSKIKQGDLMLREKTRLSSYRTRQVLSNLKLQPCTVLTFLQSETASNSLCHCVYLMVLENLHMEVLQRILISIQAACFPDFSLITNNYGCGWSWENKRICGLFTWLFCNLTSVFYCWTKDLLSLNQNRYQISGA
jgi:hypothetical protein